MGVSLRSGSTRFARLGLCLSAVLAGFALASFSALGAPANAARHSAVSVKTYKLVPKVQRTVRSTGYSTYTFNAPPGQRILSANARIVGAQRHAVVIRSRAITNSLTRYVVKLVFGGEQGNPGKLVVRLATVG